MPINANTLNFTVLKARILNNNKMKVSDKFKNVQTGHIWAVTALNGNKVSLESTGPDGQVAKATMTANELRSLVALGHFEKV